MEFLLNPEFKIYVHSSWLNQQSHVCFEYKKSLQILYSTSMEAYFQKYIQFFLHALKVPFNGEPRGYMPDSHMYLISLNFRGFFFGYFLLVR